MTEEKHAIRVQTFHDHRRRPFVTDNSKKRGALLPLEAFPDAYRILR